MNNQFEDKVVYITGAANGIGKAAADVFQKEVQSLLYVTPIKIF